MMDKLQKIALSGFFIGCFVNVCFADVAVIAHPSNPASNLDEKTVKRIFLGKMNRFPSGGAVAAVDQSRNSPALEHFYEIVVKKDSSRLKKYWTKMVLSGKGQKLQTVGDDEAVKALGSRS